MKSILKNSLLIFSLCLIVSACKKDEKKSEDQCSKQLERQTSELIHLVQNFSTNPTRNGCNNIKTKTAELVKEANKCNTFDSNLYRDALKGAESIDCSVF